MGYLAVVSVVGLLIAIHELGHLVAAKLCGIPVARFSVGFGHRVIGFRRSGTEYRLSLVPLGLRWDGPGAQSWQQDPASVRSSLGVFWSCAASAVLTYHSQRLPSGPDSQVSVFSA